jgi:hypothetical protein
MAYVRRIPLKYWEWSASEFSGTLLVFAQTILIRPTMTWKMLLRNSMQTPIMIGTVGMSNGQFPLWIYKGHLWVTCLTANVHDVAKKAANTKPRYNTKDQWWWGFVDPSIVGIMENMDRTIFGLKQRHDNWWNTLQPKKRASLKRESTGISVRDNRYIPQWVKIQVVLRDQGRCVYCGETDAKLLEFDHKKAWSKGGSSKDPFNICLGCKNCNRKKSDKDWGWG